MWKRCFQGYLFVTAADPKALYWNLKEIPGLTKLLRAEEEVFLAVSQEEQAFLEDLIDGDREKIVRLSEVKLDEEKNILSAKGTTSEVCEPDREKENTAVLRDDRKRTVRTEEKDPDRDPDRGGT